MPLPWRRALDVLRKISREKKISAYLVGGTVRDLLSGRQPRDLDIAVEADAALLAKPFARAVNGCLSLSPRFGTAAVEAPGPEPFRADFATLRRESYEHPAALPRVTPAGIGEDLFRRDFTVNAMALPLSARRWSDVIDPFGGRSDLKHGRIRFLHSRSPHDDPTRALRAVRLATRLKFRMTPPARRAIREAIAAGAFDRLSGDRLRREVFLLFEECAPAVAVAALRRTGLDRTISPRFSRSRQTAARFARLAQLGSGFAPEARPFPAIAVWSLELAGKQRRRLVERLALSPMQARLLEGLPADAKRVSGLVGRAETGALAVFVRRWPEERILATAAMLGKSGGRRLVKAWRRSRDFKLSISGEDLRAAGISAGPAIGAALEKTWKARIDGKLTRAGELPYAVNAGRR